MSKYDQITYEVDGILGKIYLNRPKKLNAYTPDMGDEIIDAFRDANNNNNIVVIALLGHGKSFCAGADKDYLLGKKKSKSGLKIGEDEFISSFVKELASSNKILIGGIKGACIGIGITMLLPFDIRIAESNSMISFPFTKLGILPGLASSYFLPSLVGLNKAKQLILNNSKLKADEALSIGLINDIVDEGKVESKIDEYIDLYRTINKDILFKAKQAFSGDCLEEEVQNAINRETNLSKLLNNFT